MDPGRRDDPHAGIDFVVTEDHAGATGADEELAGAEPPPSSPLRRNLLLGAVVLAAFALIARGVSGHDNPTPASPASSTAAASAVPTAIPTSDGAQVLQGSASAPADVRVAGGTGGCPTGNTCTRVSWLPDATMTALELAFPQIVVQSSSSLLTTDPDRLGHGDLVSRSIYAAAGNTDVSITMQTYHPGDSSGGRIWVTGERVTSYWVGQAGGCTITVAVSRGNGAGPQPHSTLQQLANDSDLAAPQ